MCTTKQNIRQTARQFVGDELARYTYKKVHNFALSYRPGMANFYVGITIMK